ncbi:hypothetical protein M378DRAFT_166560 [Amanita muscaria Koide BX008]|uniref:Uncharacterized protein n=1 Tax=Amanita muscaria (strain Koide BX008) TaxID=946122 RepID=A0A0C2WJN4_AMAMK|nr:hypothetical protein M378DRAFT_166560 [Amanita muscaria Koide BX008]
MSQFEWDWENNIGSFCLNLCPPLDVPRTNPKALRSLVINGILMSLSSANVVYQRSATNVRISHSDYSRPYKPIVT